MKPARILLTLLIVAGLRADEPGVKSTDPARLSPEVTQKLTAVLPKYAPPAPVEAKPANAPNPDVLELPKVTVTQKKRPRLTPEVMMTNTAFNQKLAHDNLSVFDRDFLNKFTLPLFGISAEQRAREEYERQKRAQLIMDVNNIAKVAEQIDPAKAKALRDDAAKP